MLLGPGPLTFKMAAMPFEGPIAAGCDRYAAKITKVLNCTGFKMPIGLKV